MLRTRRSSAWLPTSTRAIWHGCSGLARALEAGMVGINEGITTTEVAPFGGVKEGGIGREGSCLGIQEFLNVKCMSLGGL
jgi:acyl-CoA reductase-like NAD-dependent aldehyde dehydrogenase